MTPRLLRAGVVAAVIAAPGALPAVAGAHATRHGHSAHHARTHVRHHRLTRSTAALTPMAVQAPESPGVNKDTGSPDCTTPAPVHTYADLHCYTPDQIRAAYDVNGGTPLAGDITNGGQNQTIVLVDAYGSPTAANDLNYFAQSFGGPTPNFTEVYPQGKPDYNNIAHGQGLSGPNGAAGWSGEATLDIEWAYSIAPKAHIVLLAVPPAETLGVQGLPNLFKAIQWAINTYPAGTLFSQSFGITEQTFEGAGTTQVAKYDAVYQNGLQKGDTFIASSGDNGTTGSSKQHKGSTNYSYATAGWPATSPYVTAAGGTQLQYGWTWDPTSNVPFNTDGSYNDAYFNATPGGNTEAVWNESWLPAASGGGPSVLYPMPSWQQSVAPIIGQNARAVPDISWNAAVNGGVLVYITAYPNYQRAGWHVYGGTSAASPQLAGVVALANEARSNAGKGPIGYLNPLLYSGTLSPSDFRDIVPITEGLATGSNPGSAGDLTSNTLWQYNADGSVGPSSVPGWPTLKGWDMTTGFGSPDASAFVADLAAH
jgi:subtilase family serine protease